MSLARAVLALTPVLLLLVPILVQREPPKAPAANVNVTHSITTTPACGVCGPLGDGCGLSAEGAEALSRREHLHTVLHNTTHAHAFFRYFRANLQAECPRAALGVEGLCTSPDCAVQSCADGLWWSVEEAGAEADAASGMDAARASTSPSQGRTGADEEAGSGAGSREHKGSGTVSMGQRRRSCRRLNAALDRGTVGDDSDKAQWRDDTALAYCVPDEARAPLTALEVVDLQANPERFTGFDGEAAHGVWRAIYDSNCFVKTSAWLQRGPGGESSGPEGVGNGDEDGDGNVDVEFLAGPALPWETTDTDAAGGSSMVRPDPANMCLEERVVYRLLSGMHASISLHICHGWPVGVGGDSSRAADQWSVDGASRFEPNLTEFERRFSNETTGGHGTGWLRNLYFSYATVLRAVLRAKPLWEKYPFNAAPVESPSSPAAAACRDNVQRLLQAAATACPADGGGVFDESRLFRGGDAANVQRELRAHFRHVSEIMNCVGCLKCRLWGKLQVRGLATALRILTADAAEMEETGAADASVRPLALAREDVVALFLTLERLSASIGYLRNFDSLQRAATAAGI